MIELQRVFSIGANFETDDNIRDLLKWYLGAVCKYNVMTLKRGVRIS